MIYKFRGLQKNAGEWVYGTGILEDGHNTWIISNQLNKPIAFGQISSIVLPDTVGQYLGFKDKNEVCAYQGDVLRVPFEDCSSKIFQKMKELGDKYIDIIFDIESPYLTTCFRTHDEDNYFTGSSINGDNVLFLRYLIDKGTSEIIGNVTQNPELLEAKA